MSVKVSRARGVGPEAYKALVEAQEYDPDMPWEWCFTQAMESSSQWWMVEFEEPAYLVLSRIGRLDDMLGGDAPLGVSSAASVAAPGVLAPSKRQTPDTPVAAPPGQAEQEEDRRPLNARRRSCGKSAGGLSA